MLQLKNIIKDYVSGDTVVHALKGVSMDFRKSEFVAVLGQSGCGKTTLLNIIGGLDRYTSGDLIINSKSTTKFKDADWDTYRNHSIGFVFQSYNLIPHQSVLSNVELALTLTGVSKSERRRRAVEALEKVGLGDQINKKPNQMSGGQMQRVAIARAIVNDPDILLADEPTGALDTATSVQIMDILKSISEEKLIIMVTHNPDLAEEYASRIIKLSDGEVISDSNPYDATEDEQAIIAEREAALARLSEKERKQAVKSEKKKQKKPSMSFFTALSLSLNNLMTKKTRTLLTSFAGSIGIIGIALILALSTGIQTYIDDVQEDTLSSYPISIYAQETDMAGMIASLAGNSEKNKHEKDAVYSNTMMYQLMNAMNEETAENNMVDFKTFLDKEMNEDTSDTELYKYAKAISYSYNVPINAYTKDSSGEYIKADIMELFTQMAAMMMQGADSETSANSASSMSSMMTNSTSSAMQLWSEILPGQNGELISPMIEEQYDLVYGSWPTAKNEVVLILTQNNEVSDFALYSLGLKDMSDMVDVMQKAQNGEIVDDTVESWSYEEICNINFKLVTSADYYSYSEKTQLWQDMSTNSEYMNILLKDNSLELDIVGIIRPTEDSNFAIMTGSIGYTTALTEYIIDKTNNSDVVKAQQDPANNNVDIFNGKPFYIPENMSVDERIEMFKEYCASLSDSGKRELYTSILSGDSEEINQKIDAELQKYPTKDEKITAIINMSAEAAGVSPDVIKSMVNNFDGYTEEQIEENLRVLLTEVIGGASGEEAIDIIIKTPSQEELDMLVSASLEQIKASSPMITTDYQAKIAFIGMVYSTQIQMPQDMINTYLMSLSEQEIDAIIENVLKLQYVSDGTYEANADAKVAAVFDEYIASCDNSMLLELFEEHIDKGKSESSYEQNLALLGVADMADPYSINIYASTFEAKDKIAEIIEGYNAKAEEKDDIKYTDYVAILMSSISTVINAISYVLIAFVSISLIVSSIMIGIITYISVLERTKEIGILRSVGASKKDVSRIFNAETVIEGFASGAIGVLITILLCIPANFIIQKVTGIAEIAAVLPVPAAIILVLISILLSVIAGLFPAKVAAKKDPVVALRSE